MRKLSREVLFKMVFAYRYGIQSEEKQSFDELFNTITEEFKIDKNDLDFDYIKTGYEDIKENFKAYDDIISKKVSRYNVNRIFNSDLIILNIALFEINELKTEPKIIISEAIKLAKKYSTEQSIKFVNGVLGSILKDKNE